MRVMTSCPSPAWCACASVENSAAATRAAATVCLSKRQTLAVHRIRELEDDELVVIRLPGPDVPPDREREVVVVDHEHGLLVEEHDVLDGLERERERVPEPD